MCKGVYTFLCCGGWISPLERWSICTLLRRNGHIPHGKPGAEPFKTHTFFFELPPFQMSTAGTAASSRYCASIVSRFMIPGQMAAFDVLARASTFPVSASSAAHASRNDAPEHHWVTSKHVVAPFFYRDSFYREQAEWLRFV